MNILITGSAGRVGRAVYLKLMRYFNVTGVDTVPASTVDHIGSINDNEFLADLPDNYDIVIHIAALHAPHVNVFSKSDFVSINVNATKMLVNWALSRNLQQLIFLSSTAVYGYASTLPGQTNWITEQTNPQPKTIYHSTKLAAEKWLESFSDDNNIAITVLRMSRCFPESADKMAFYRLHRGVDVRDVASAHLAVIQTQLQGFNIFNISGHTPFEKEHCEMLYRHADKLIAELVPEMAAEFDKRSWRLPKQIDRIYYSGKANALLNWQPKYGFQAVLDWLDDEMPEVMPVLNSSRF